MNFDEEDEGEGWLVSYADMMTLIACFFILMMAFANYDPVGFNIKAEQLSKSFRIDKNKSSQIKFKEITEEIAKHELKDRTKISLKDGELIVTFSSSVIFEKESSQLSEEAMNTLDAMIDIIKTSGANYRILIEGHSDDGDEPENTWRLASDRAVTVADRFSYFGFPEDKIVPISRGNVQKLTQIAPTDSKLEKERKRSLNRRVVLRLLEPKEKKKVKFGFGVYFKDATENVKEDSIDTIDESDFDID